MTVVSENVFESLSSHPHPLPPIVKLVTGLILLLLLPLILSLTRDNIQNLRRKEAMAKCLRPSLAEKASHIEQF